MEVNIKSSGMVALFFRSEKPHRLAPASIMVIENWDSGVGRTVAHRGFDTSPLAVRKHTPLEAEQMSHYFRYHMEFYSSWAQLISDEQARVNEDPSIGTHFLSVCQRLATDSGYKPKVLPAIQRKVEADMEAALLAEASHLLKPELDAFEKRVVKEFAAAIGATQLDLFGEEVYGA